MGLTIAERVLVARLSGVAARHASGQEARSAAVLGMVPGDPVADLHAVSTDPHLLSVAAAMYVGDDHWYGSAALSLLVTAGADLDAARMWRAEHPPRPFRPAGT